MIKGKTIIELTDVNTGEVERHEDNNMVTNALNKIFEPFGHLKHANILYSTLYPYYQKLLGGLLLFDGEIPENADTVFAPENVNLTGCGVYGEANATTGTARGNFNMTESEVDIKRKYAKYVYDFSTNQGNGNISCACLTSNRGGYTAYGSKDAASMAPSASSGIPPMMKLTENVLGYVNPRSTGNATGDKETVASVGKTEFIFAIDKENDWVYYFKINSLVSISIIKRKAYINGLSVFENPYAVKDLIEEINIDTLSLGMLSTYFSYNFDKEDRALYIVSQKSNSAVRVDENIRVIKIEFETWHVSEIELVNQTGENLTTASSRHVGCYVFKGSVYILGSKTPYNIYKISLGDSSNVEIVNHGEKDAYNGRYAAFEINGRIFYDCSSTSDKFSASIVNTYTNTEEFIEYGYLYTYANGNYYTYTPIIGNAFYWFVSRNDQWSPAEFVSPAFYLATINNLSSPVVKTADKTMKVTYIIQEVAG